MSSSPKHLEYQTQKRRILIDVPFLLQKIMTQIHCIKHKCLNNKTEYVRPMKYFMMAYVNPILRIQALAKIHADYV